MHQGNFGPTLKTGDKCSILVKLVDSRIKVYIILNAKSLGLAFDVLENTLDGIYPAVKFLGEGSVEIEESLISDAPVVLEPVKPLIIAGNWTLHSLGDDDIMSRTNVTMKLTEIYDRVYDRAYRLRINFINKFIGTLIEKSSSNWTAEIIDKTAKQGTTTEMDLEGKVTKHITEIGNVAFDSGKNELRFESLDFGFDVGLEANRAYANNRYLESIQ